MSDVDIADVTAAADKIEALLPHRDELREEIPMRRGYSFAELISELDKQSLLEFGRNIV